MNFTTPIFFFFFVFILLIRWLIPIYKEPNRLILLFLLISSYIFYATWSFEFSLLILFTTISDFYLGKKIYQSQSKKKVYLFASIFIDLLILSIFKYYNFFIQNVFSILSIFGLSVSVPILSIALPAGISFYTFQSMSYTIDIYRKEIEPEKSLLRYSFYLAFFPQLVAGPIVVAKYFLPQLNLAPQLKFRDIKIREASYYLIMGFIKKSVVADRISVLSDLIFGNPDPFSGSALLVGVVSYSVQIYCDFSGYTDIARGLALLLGFELPENFIMPYFASSLRDFWRRWHITLSSWLKNYLYIPLGGNRNHQYRNLFLTMLLGGLWHGASWNFVIWGALHGAYLAVENFIRKILEKYLEAKQSKSILTKSHTIYPMVLKTFYGLWIFGFVCFCWIFFRAKDFTTAWKIITGIFQWKSGVGLLYTQKKIFYWISFTTFLSHILGTRYSVEINSYLKKEPKLLDAVILALATIIGVLLSSDAKPFIYFVF